MTRDEVMSRYVIPALCIVYSPKTVKMVLETLDKEQSDSDEE